jgi:hypothetical protein
MLISSQNPQKVIFQKFDLADFPSFLMIFGDPNFVLKIQFSATGDDKKTVSGSWGSHKTQLSALESSHIRQLPSGSTNSLLMAVVLY